MKNFVKYVHIEIFVINCYITWDLGGAKRKGTVDRIIMFFKNAGEYESASMWKEVLTKTWTKRGVTANIILEDTQDASLLKPHKQPHS